MTLPALRALRDDLDVVLGRPLAHLGIAPWLAVALREVGQAERRGGENPRIIEYHAATTWAPTKDEVPWCASFACWCLEQAGFAHTNSTLARRFERYGEPVSGDSPPLGAIAVLYRGNRTPWTDQERPPAGHVGFVLNARDGFVRVLGGNQSDSVKVSAYPAADVITYRWPT